jgi:hypothetical protein
MVARKFDPTKPYKELKENSAPKFDPKKPYKELTDEDQESSFGEDALELAQMVGEGIDRYTGAPTRAAIQAGIEAPMGDKLSAAGTAFKEQIGEPTRMAPTGSEVAESMGFEGTYQYPKTNIMGRSGAMPEMGEAQVSNIPGLMVDVLADWTLLTKLPVKTAQMLVQSSPALRKKVLSEGGEKVLNTFMDDVSVGQVNKLMQGPSGTQEFFDRTVGSLLLQEDLAKLSGKPNRLLDKIAGKEVTEETMKGLVSKRSGGLIAEKGQKVKDIIRKLRKSKFTEPDGITTLKGGQISSGEELLKATKDEIIDRSTKMGKTLSPEELKYVDDVLQRELEPMFVQTQRDMFQGDVNPRISFEEMHKLKQELGETLRENAFKTNPLEANVRKDMVLLDLYHVMKKELDNKALLLDPKLGEEYIRANADMSALLTLKKALTSQRAKEFKKLAKGGAGMDALLTLVGGAGGLASAQLFGFNPVTSTMVGMGLGGSSRRLMQRTGEAAREFGARNVGRIQTGNVLQGAGEEAAFGAYKGLQSTGAMGQEPMFQENSRSPQSVPNFNPMVEDKLIPRSSEWVMAHPNLTRAKLLKAAPELAAQVSIALERKDMKTLQKVMPQIANMVPHVFEQDDFGIFDGKIIDPNMKALYSEKVMNDLELDSIEKAEILDHLNRTNEVLR